MTQKQKILHLQRDRVLARAIAKIGRLQHGWAPGNQPDHFKSLVVAIINQQLSGKAADTIQARFEALFANGRRRKKFPTPKEVLAMSLGKLRRVGLSKMKASFIKDLAKKVLNGTVDFRAMKKWSDEEVIMHLTAVKGIGRWTAEMFLIFSLGREDVFSYGDLGLRNAIQRLYKMRAHPTPAQAEKITARWSPYRSLACLYLWASLSNR